jgi:hypothetical protein
MLATAAPQKINVEIHGEASRLKGLRNNIAAPLGSPDSEHRQRGYVVIERGSVHLHLHLACLVLSLQILDPQAK